MIEQPSTASRTVLFVDDEDNVLRALRRALRRTGWNILTASSGAEALTLLEREPVDVVISDFRMPVMNGVELLRQVKERWPDTQRVMLTGQADQATIQEAVNRSEILRFLSKPWDDTDLLAVVSSALETAELARENRRLLQLTLQKNQELAALNASLEEKVKARTEELARSMAWKHREERFAAVGRLAGGVAHELNNPLSGVLAFSQIMRSEPNRSAADLEALALIEESAVRCKRIVESLLRFAGGTGDAQKQHVDLRRVTADTVLLFKPHLKHRRGVALEQSADPQELPSLLADPHALGQALMDLLTQRLAATPDGAKLELQVFREGRALGWRVRDFAPPISQTAIEQLSDPLAENGTLALVYRTASEHGGRVEVEPLADGNRITLSLFFPEQP